MNSDNHNRAEQRTQQQTAVSDFEGPTGSGSGESTGPDQRARKISGSLLKSNPGKPDIPEALDQPSKKFWSPSFAEGTDLGNCHWIHTIARHLVDTCLIQRAAQSLHDRSSGDASFSGADFIETWLKVSEQDTQTAKSGAIAFSHSAYSSSGHDTTTSLLLRQNTKDESMAWRNSRLLAREVGEILVEIKLIEACQPTIASGLAKVDIQMARTKSTEAEDDGGSQGAHFFDSRDVHYVSVQSHGLSDERRDPHTGDEVSSQQSSKKVPYGEHRLRQIGRSNLESNMESFDIDGMSDTLSTLVNRLSNTAAERLFCSILSQTGFRSAEEVKFVAHEMQFIPAFEQFDTAVRSQLARFIRMVVYREAGSKVFSQGETGLTWYIIYHGKVWVEVVGKGRVCQLSEGDEFGKLAILTDNPRAASVITGQDNCYLLAVNKSDFNRILVSSEARMVRLKENDTDVLICVKQPPTRSARLSVGTLTTVTRRKVFRDSRPEESLTPLAGTLEKIVHFLLDHGLGQNLSTLVGQLDGSKCGFCLMYQSLPDTISIAVEDFFLASSVLLDGGNPLFAILLNYASHMPRSDPVRASSDIGNESPLNRVIIFVLAWCHCIGLAAMINLPGLFDFLTKLVAEIPSDHDLSAMTSAVQRLRTDLLAMGRGQNELRRKSLTRYSTSLDAKMPTGISLATTSVTTVSVSRLKTQGGVRRRVGNRGLLDGFELLSRSPNDLIHTTIALEDTDMTPRVNHAIEKSEPFNVFLPSWCQIYPKTLPLRPSFTQITCTFDIMKKLRRKIKLVIPIEATVGEIKARLFSELKHYDLVSHDNQEMCLVELMSNSSRNLLDNNDKRFVLTELAPNSRVVYADHHSMSEVVPLPGQLSSTMRYVNKGLGSDSVSLNQRRDGLLDIMTVEQLGTLLTYTQLKLATCVTPEELIGYTLNRYDGTHQSCGPHLNLIIAGFTRVYYWTITQVVTTLSLTQRTDVVKKLIKLAYHVLSAPFHDEFNCFAIIMGLNNSAVSRLSQTWDRLPAKWLRCYTSHLQPLIDPSRNHRAARDWLTGIENKAYLPFLALILKDLRFSTDANPTVWTDPQRSPSSTTGDQSPTSTTTLLNFEKVHLVARSIRLWMRGVSQYAFMHPLVDKVQFPLNLPQADPDLIRRFEEVTRWPVTARLMENLECIDDARIIDQLSRKLEPGVQSKE